MTKQPTSLKLADELLFAGRFAHESEDGAARRRINRNFEAATELRRLHEVNQELLEALKGICDCPQFVDEATVPKAGIEAAPQQVVVNMSVALVRLRKARAAIAKATGEQA